MCLSVCQSVSLCVRQSACVCQSSCQFLSVSVCLSVCLSVCVSVCLCLSACVCLSVGLPVSVSLSVPVILSVCLSVSQSSRPFFLSLHSHSLLISFITLFSSCIAHLAVLPVVCPLKRIAVPSLLFLAFVLVLHLLHLNS